MSGIYIHIPFCKRKCSYCDFFTVNFSKYTELFTAAISKEIADRSDYLNNHKIDTIYFGGGTPSQLKAADFEKIFRSIADHFVISNHSEITFEGNPDDLTADYLQSISHLPFNRISIGIQSFDDTELKRINRRHSALQAIEAVEACKKKGFRNISIDLIFGLPEQTNDNWIKQLRTAIDLNIQHISVYGLTFEENTPLWSLREKGKVIQIEDEKMNKMYIDAIDILTGAGFEQYEISNFAKPDFRSRHNSAYWRQEPYLGVGPSAHSYDGKSRRWNVSSIEKYLSGINNNFPCFEEEILSVNDKYNDYVMLALRTTDGIDLRFIETNFGKEFSDYCLESIKTFIDTEKIKQKNNQLRLNTGGMLISNLIISEIMKV